MTWNFTETIKWDNVPPFNSKEFKDYLAKLGVEHETSTPKWPHCPTEVPPAQLLFSRPVRGILSMLNPKAKVLNRYKEAKSNDSNVKDKGREYANK